MSHQEPSDDLDCQICFCPIDADSYCEYKTHLEDPSWTPCSLCLDCIMYLKSSLWQRHLDLVEKIDCRRAAIEVCRNVPTFVHEHTALICPTHGKECPLKGQIELLWTKVDDREQQPILDGAKLGEEREAYIAHLLQYAEMFEQDKEEDLAKMRAASPVQEQQQPASQLSQQPLSPTSPVASPQYSPQVLSQHDNDDTQNSQSSH